MDLLALTDGEMVRLVNEAFKNYDSLVELSHSPLALSALVQPALVLDEVAPTTDERGRALRVLLRWAVNRLAPAPPHYPLDVPRPFDDPTWMDPLWWHYNLLRHRYLEPLRPDDLAQLGAGGFTDALLNLTGIANADSLFDERKRAVRQVALLLQRQGSGREADAELRRLAIEGYSHPLRSIPTARELLALAATFRGPLPAEWLLDLAAAEQLPSTVGALAYLIQHRLLVEREGGAQLYLPDALQAYLYPRQPADRLVARHRRVAALYRQQGQWVVAARHLQQGNQPADAAALLLAAPRELLAEAPAALREIWQAWQRETLPAASWQAIQLLGSDLFRQLGYRDEAVEACRRALKATTAPGEQARLHRRLGKLYEDYNQRHALLYYQRAIELFAPGDPELPETLKDRGWIFIHRQEWASAEADLTLALATAPPDAPVLRADIYDELASLYRQQANYEQAIGYAQQALALREEMGDLLRVADSFNNLGLAYAKLGELDHAIAAYQDALTTYQKMDHREAMATAQLNLGAAFYYAEDFEQAIAHYQASLNHFEGLGSWRGSAQAHYNLAEAYIALGQGEQAQHHWRVGYALCQEQADLSDQLTWFEQLRPHLPAPAVPALSLPPDETLALEIARREGQVTTSLLMEQAGISKATATRRLAALAEAGRLVKVGEGRGTRYLLPEG